MARPGESRAHGSIPWRRRFAALLLTAFALVAALALPTPAQAADGPSVDTVRQQVLAVVEQAKHEASDYADIAVSEDGQTWNVAIAKDAEPVVEAATDIVAPVVEALQNADATSVTTGSMTLQLGGVLPNRIAAFATYVLGNAAQQPDEPGAVTTLAALVGRTASFTASVGESSMTFSFAFAAADTTVPVFRLYNPFDHQHLYTTDANEVSTLHDSGWIVDFNGEPAWYAPTEGSGSADHRVIRLYNPYSHDHYFVDATDEGQIDLLTSQGWTRDSESSAIWSAAPDAANVEVITLFNPAGAIDTHLWTTDQHEIDDLSAHGWRIESTTLWGIPKP